MPRPRLILADDHAEFLALTASLLSADFEVLQTAADADELMEAAQRLHPDVLVLDISMPGISGIEAARRLRAAGCDSRIVFLTVHQDPDFISSGLAAGAQGYVFKSRLATELISALQQVLAGGGYCSSPEPATRR